MLHLGSQSGGQLKVRTLRSIEASVSATQRLRDSAFCTAARSSSCRPEARPSSSSARCCSSRESLLRSSASCRSARCAARSLAARSLLSSVCSRSTCTNVSLMYAPDFGILRSWSHTSTWCPTHQPDVTAAKRACCDAQSAVGVFTLPFLCNDQYCTCMGSSYRVQHELHVFIPLEIPQRFVHFDLGKSTHHSLQH
jgi:hypothetical protein